VPDLETKGFVEQAESAHLKMTFAEYAKPSVTRCLPNVKMMVAPHPFGVLRQVMACDFVRLVTFARLRQLMRVNRKRH
jgi:hypothetical protein